MMYWLNGEEGCWTFCSCALYMDSSREIRDIVVHNKHL